MELIVYFYLFFFIIIGLKIKIGIKIDWINDIDINIPKLVGVFLQLVETYLRAITELIV